MDAFWFTQSRKAAKTVRLLSTAPQAFIFLRDERALRADARPNVNIFAALRLCVNPYLGTVVGHLSPLAILNLTLTARSRS